MHDGNSYEKNVRNNQLICAKKLSFLFVPFHDYLREINTVCVFLYFKFWQNYYHKFWLCNDDVSLSVRPSVCQHVKTSTLISRKLKWVFSSNRIHMHTLIGPRQWRFKRFLVAKTFWLFLSLCSMFQNGMNAVSMRVAESYVDAFSNLAKTSNTVLLPANTGDVSSMVSQVCTYFLRRNPEYMNTITL